MPYTTSQLRDLANEALSNIRKNTTTSESRLNALQFADIDILEAGLREGREEATEMSLADALSSLAVVSIVVQNLQVQVDELERRLVSAESFTQVIG